MDLDQPQLGKVPDLTGLSGKVALGLTGCQSRLWRFLGICLLAAVVSSPARWAGGVYQETSPSAKVQNTWLTAHVSAAATTPTAPTITFDQPPDVTVGTPVPLTVSTSPPDLPVFFKSDTPLVCTVADSTVTTVTVGTCTITALQHGKPPYAAPEVTRSFQVQAPTAPTITFDQPPDVTVGTPVPLTASASPPDLPVFFKSDTLPVCTVADSTVTTVAAGTCTITAYQAPEARQAAPNVTRSFQVNPVQATLAPQTITFGQPPGATVGTPAVLSARASSGLPVSFSSDTPSVCTVTGSTVTTVAAGPCTITASQSGSARYAAAPNVTRSFQVNPVPAGPAPQTITFGQPPGATVGTPAVLSARASSGLPVSFSSDTPSVCTVTGSTVTTVAAGPCTITASQSGSARYAAAPNVTRSFQVNPVPAGPAPQTITFRQPPGATVGTPAVLSARASSGLPVSFSSDTPSVCTVTGSTVTTVAAGPCTITASQGGSARYAAAPDVTRSFQENPPTSKGAGALVSLLAAAAVILAAAAGALAVRRRWLRRHVLPTPTPRVRVEPHTGPPGLVSVHTTGTDATHTVHIEPSPGTSTTTIEEARP